MVYFLRLTLSIGPVGAIKSSSKEKMTGPEKCIHPSSSGSVVGEREDVYEREREGRGCPDDCRLEIGNCAERYSDLLGYYLYPLPALLFILPFFDHARALFYEVEVGNDFLGFC